MSCGQPVEAAGNCAVTIAKPVPVPVGQCIELTSIVASPPCPVGFSTVRSLRFAVTAHTSRGPLRWRRSANSSDVLEPSSGTVANNGRTEVLLADIVLGDWVSIEIVDGDEAILRFVLRHY